MTHQFYCHYTGKDGHTPRRRKQALTFFDNVPTIGNSTSSPTPLWAEVIRGKQSDMLILHAQLSEEVAVYTEFYLSTGMCNLMSQPELSVRLKKASEAIVKHLRKLTDFTSWLKGHPERITPPVLAAYKEARPDEYQILQSLSNN